RDFWKLLAFVDNDDERFKVKAYVLTQDNLLNDIEALDLDPFRLYQVSLGELESLTGLAFGQLKDADTFTPQLVKEALAAGAKREVREVTSRDDVIDQKG